MTAVGEFLLRAETGQRRGEILLEELKRERERAGRQRATDLLTQALSRERLQDIIEERRRRRGQEKAAQDAEVAARRELRDTADFFQGLAGNEDLRQLASDEEVVRIGRQRMATQEEIRVRRVPPGRTFAPSRDEEKKEEQRRKRITGLAQTFLKDQLGTDFSSASDAEIDQAFLAAERFAVREERFFEPIPEGDVRNLRGRATELTMRIAQQARERGQPTDPEIDQIVQQQLDLIANMDEEDLRAFIELLKSSVGNVAPSPPTTP